MPLLGPKERLVSYRELAVLTIGLLGFCVAWGIVDHRPMGFGFMLLLGVSAVGYAVELFRWHAEPTARRQFATALLLTCLLSVVGAFGVDLAIAQYHLRMGECPVWLDFAGRCHL